MVANGGKSGCHICEVFQVASAQIHRIEDGKVATYVKQAAVKTNMADETPTIMQKKPKRTPPP